MSERHPDRLHAYILLRGRGARNLYLKKNDSFVPVCNNYDKDLPLKYANYVAVYLILVKL